MMSPARAIRLLAGLATAIFLILAVIAMRQGWPLPIKLLFWIGALVGMVWAARKEELPEWLDSSARGAQPGLGEGSRHGGAKPGANDGSGDFGAGFGGGGET